MIKSRLLIAILILPSILVGCASSKHGTSIQPKLSIIDIPPIGLVATAEIGETLVKKGRVYEFDAIHLHNTIRLNFVQVGSDHGEIAPCKMIAFKQVGDYVYYRTDRLLFHGAYTSGGLKVNINNENDVRGYWDDALAFTREPKPKPAAVISREKVIDINSPSIMQELIYNGKVGNSIKFLYREVSNSAIRGPFTQEVQYDLSDGNIVGFKGVRLQILEATNTMIRYSVIASFPGIL